MVERSAELDHDVPTDDEPEAQSHRFRGVEWREDLLQGIVRHARAVVGDREPRGRNVYSGFDFDRRISRITQGLYRILQKIDHNLLELDAIGEHLRIG